MAIALSHVHGATLTTSTTTITHTGCAFGPVAADRELIAVIGDSDSTGTSNLGITGVTIGGVTATRDGGVGEGSAASHMSIWRALVPTGTSGSVAITRGGSGANRNSLSLYRMTGHDNAQGVHDSGASRANGASGDATSLDIPANGCGIVGAHRVVNTTITYSEATHPWTTDHQGSAGSQNAFNKSSQVSASAITVSTAWTSPSGSGSSASTAAVSYAPAGNAPITKDVILDYKIRSVISKDLILDYRIRSVISKDLILDYMIEAGFTKSIILDYKIELMKSVVFTYEIEVEQNPYYASRLITPGTGELVDNNTDFDTATVIDGAMVFAAVGQPVNPELSFIADPIAAHPVLNFYGDFYLRIWLDPDTIRINNPIIGRANSFNIWSAYPFDNDLIEVLNLDLDGVSLDFEVPLTFDPYEYKTLTFTITADAPPVLDGYFDFYFEEGSALLHVTATVIDLLRALPNEPVTEVWSWKTSVSGTNSEQRMSLRSEPRIAQSYSVQIVDEDQRRLRYRQLYRFISRTLQFPMFQYMVDITADASEGTFKLLFDPALTNLRDDEFAALYNSQSDEFYVIKVATVDIDGCTLESELSVNVEAGWFLIPCYTGRMPNNEAIQMRAVEGDMTISSESVAYRTLLRPDASADITQLNGIDILSVRPIAAQDINEEFDGGNTSWGNDRAFPVVSTVYALPFISENWQWLLERETDMDYWRQFMSNRKGRQKAFYCATWRDDLGVSVMPDPGDTVIRVSETNYIDYFEFDTYKQVQIETLNGIIYRTVTNVEVEGDGSLSVTLGDALGSNPGDGTIKRISYLNLCRLDSDQVRLDHYRNHTILSASVRTINE